MYHLVSKFLRPEFFSNSRKRINKWNIFKYSEKISFKSMQNMESRHTHQKIKFRN